MDLSPTTLSKSVVQLQDEKKLSPEYGTKVALFVFKFMGNFAPC